MYESQTFDSILNRMLNRIPNDLDKREGSIIFDALAPAAAELAQLYIELDTNLNLSFAETTSGEFLDRRIAWSGIVRKPATKAMVKAEFYNSQNSLMDVPIGSRFSAENTSYTVKTKTSQGIFQLECETPGVVGNQYFGSILPTDYINGLTRAEITEISVPGEDKESDASLYERYQEKVSKPITSANKNQYEVWAREVSGVRKAKAFPLWNGPNTVKIALLNDEMRAPTKPIVDAVQNYIDPTQDGMGEGMAPIGPIVTVVAATEIPIDVSVEVTLASGSTHEDVKELLETGIRDYLSSLAFVDPLIRYTRIANIILDIPPVVDYTNLTVNGQTINIEINPGDVAVLGTVTVI